MAPRTRPLRERVTLPSPGGPAARQLGRAPEAEPVEEIAGHYPEGGEPVDHAPFEAHGARLVEITGRHGDLAYREVTGAHDLGDELLVEHEVVAVEVVRNGLEEAPAVGPQ